MRLSQAEWELAKIVCTPSQTEALDMWRRHFGYRRIGHIMNIDPSTARQHVQAGLRNLRTRLAELEQIA